MRSLKSVLAMVLAMCLMLCLAVPAFATEPTAAVTEAPAEDTVAATEDTVEATEGVEATEEESLPENTEESLPADDDTLTTGTAEGDTAEGEDAAAEEEGDSVIHTILLILEVIASALLILVVLLQSGKESGLSGALAGNSDSYMNKSGKGGVDKKLASATKWIALVWILLTLALTLVP